MITTEKPAIVTNTARIRPELKNDFVDWQGKFNAIIAAFPGFVSLEILSPMGPNQPEWTFVQRFNSVENVTAWRNSQVHQKLMEELKRFLVQDGKDASKEMETGTSTGSVTEVFVTQVSAEKEKAYREWIAKIHQVEAKFPGFRGVYVQSPGQNRGGNWITFLQFDSPENLDRWLSSPERQKVLNESKSLISSLDTHRVISPYAGWFSSIAQKGAVPPVWKQTMIILLVLFPIVMLEFKYLSLLTAGLNPSLATFISNAISVTLLAWPMLPIAIWLLTWWLTPKEENRQQATVFGTFFILSLYLIEIAIFWKLM